MGTLRGLLLTAGSCFRLCERDVSSSLRLTRSSDLKIINGFCIKPQESPRAPSRTYSHRVPLHKPTDWQKKMLIWSGRFKKEDEIPETVSLEMLDAAKNKMRVKICYLMMALTVIGCIAMIIDGKKAAQRNETLTHLNLERKARLREEAARTVTDRLVVVDHYADSHSLPISFRFPRGKILHQEESSALAKFPLSSMLLLPQLVETVKGLD